MRLHTRMACSCEVESVGPDNWIALRRLCVNNTVNMCIGTNKRSDTFLCERQWQKLLCANRNLSRTHNRAEALPYLTPGRMSSHTCFVGGCVLHGWLEITYTDHMSSDSPQPLPSSDTRSNGFELLSGTITSCVFIFNAAQTFFWHKVEWALNCSLVLSHHVCKRRKR